MRLIRPAFILFLTFGATSCGKGVNNQIREAVRQFDNLDLKKDEVEVLRTEEMGGHAVAHVRIKTALKLSRQKGEWKVDEVRIGDRRWERADHILAVIEAKRTETTRSQLGALSAGLVRYLERHGQTPAEGEFSTLMEVLVPEYLSRVNPIDAWSNPFLYRRPSPGCAEVVSSGPDGLVGTSDDLVARVGK